MTENDNSGKPVWTEDLPPCLIYVDKEGRMWHQGAEMTHPGINRLLMDHVEMDRVGRYIIEFNGQRCLVEVEDTFFVVNRLEARLDPDDGVEAFLVTLNDGSQEELDLESFNQSEDNVLYTRVKAGRFPARFLRAAYYQLAEYIVEYNGKYVLVAGGRQYPVV